MIATHVVPAGNASDPGCPTAESYSLATGLSVGTSPVAVSASLPYGTWRIDVKNSGGTIMGTENIVLSPLASNNPFTPSTLTVS